MNLVRIMRGTSGVKPNLYTKGFCSGCQVAQYGVWANAARLRPPRSAR